MSFSSVIRTAAVSLIATSTVACHPHVELRAPEAGAPGPERVKAYESIHARSSKETHITYVNEYGTVVDAARRVDYLQLADGQRVYHPEDLMPVLASESSAYSAADRSRKNMSTARVLNGVGWGTVGVGGAVMVGGVATADYASTDTGALMTPLIIGGGIMLAGVVMTLVSSGFARKAMDEKATAFEMYNEGLAMRLNVCANEKVLVPCEEAGRTVSQERSPEETAASVSPTQEKELAPTGVAGFSFSMSPVQAESACEQAGHSWESTSSGGNCTGTPQSVGLPGRVHLVSCGKEFCELQVVAQTKGRNPFDETIEFKRALQDSYGPPATSNAVVPDECSPAPLECITSGKAHMSFAWKFPNGTGIELYLGRTPQSVGSGAVDDQIRILYRRAAPAATSPRAL